MFGCQENVRKTENVINFYFIWKKKSLLENFEEIILIIKGFKKKSFLWSFLYYLIQLYG